MAMTKKTKVQCDVSDCKEDAEIGIYNFAIHNNPNLGKYFNYNRGFDIFLDGTIYNEKQEDNKRKNIKQTTQFTLNKTWIRNKCYIVVPSDTATHTPSFDTMKMQVT